MDRKKWIDAFSIGLLLVMMWPQLCEKRMWLYATVKVAREGARRCGQLAIVAEREYHRESA